MIVMLKCMYGTSSQAKRKERLRRRVAEHKEQQERSELRAEQWLEQRRQEKLKEETVGRGGEMGEKGRRGGGVACARTLRC